MKKTRIILFALLAALVLCLTACGGGGGKNGMVRVYSFGDYFDPALVQDFEDKTGIRVVVDYFDTNEEMYPVIAKGSVDYDVICASDYIIGKMIGEDLLAGLNKDNIPNYSNLDPDYLKMAERFDPGNQYAVPHTWGTLGILYNTKHIAPGEITSWNDLWNKKYEQQIVMPDSMRDTLAIALKAKGYSLNTQDEREIKDATEHLIKQKSLVYKYANDSARDLAIGGSCDLAVVWSGEVLYAKEQNEDLEFVVPKEGTESFLDMWAIPDAAKNKENGEKWIDFMLDKGTAEDNYDYLTYTIPNKAVSEKLKDEPDEMKYIFPGQAVLERTEMLKSLSADVEEMYSKYWKQFKA